MAIIDDQNLYCDGQALTATAVSEDYIDHGADNNLGIGEPMVAVLSLDVAADDADGNETYTCILETDDNTGFSSATQVGATVTITRGDVAGTKYYIPLPPNTGMERYSRLSFTLGGTSPSVTVNARLVPFSAVQNDVYYASGYTVS